MSKRKLDTPPIFTQAQLKAFNDFIGCLPSDIPASAALEQMQEASQPDSSSYAIQALSVQDLLDSPYHHDRVLEGRTRTILDLIFLDRLRKLQDQDAAYRLRLSPEVPIEINGITDLGALRIRGIADWTLNYKSPRSGSTLVVIEAKKAGQTMTGLPQLLIYMAGIHQQRRDRINQSVFGILADYMTFVFVFLDHKMKFYISETIDWRYRKSEVLAHIDTILLDAIESSPHTTPTKKEIAVTNHYQQYLKQRWLFGNEVTEKEIAVEKAVEKEIVVVDVDEKGMVMGREKQKEADEKPSSEIAGAE